MINFAELNPYTDLDLSVFSHNLSLPRHRWYEFKEGFSEKLVHIAILDISTVRRKKIRILDPFSGSGTSLVAAGFLGVEATGIEVNPFLAFATRAKCASGKWIKRSFQNRLDNILYDSRYEILSPLEGCSTFTESPGLEKWLFNRSVLRGFASIDRALQQTRHYRRPLRLALMASLMDCCNADKDGKCLRYREGWEVEGLNSADLRNAFKRRAQEVFDDIEKHPFDSNGLNIIEGDSREQLKSLESKSYDLLITSPPYLNSFDYSDIYRPELFAGGFVGSNDELRKIRLKTIRSHVQVNWKPTQEDSSPMIPPLISKLSKKKLWNRKLPDMVQSYFADMAKILHESARLVKPKGQAWIVVSTSAYGGIEIPVDLILADIATRNCWELRSVNVLRKLRSAGQHWSHLKAGTKLPLRESLIILERG